MVKAIQELNNTNFFLIIHQHSRHIADLTAESAGVAASLSAGRASSLLQPGDESLEGEGLGEGTSAAR